ncbi:MAG: hypothetical protein ACK5P7_07625 [Bdellovibrio sp.]|jgi:hypothetical protein
MKSALAALLIGSGLLLAGCSGTGTEDLEIRTRNAQFILVDATTKSCRQVIEAPQDEDDLQPISMSIGTITIDWKGKNPLQISYMRFLLQGAGIQGGVFSKTISGSDLGYTWRGNAGIVSFPAQVGEVTSVPGCNVAIGGIPLADKTKSSSGQGSLLIYGLTADGDQDVPVQVRTYFSWRFDGIN